MIQATTPTFILSVPETVDLTEASSVYFSLRQGQVYVEKTGSDIDVYAHEVDVYLSQAETIQFAEGPAQMQLNWTYGGGERASTNIVTIDVTPNLIKRVLV